MLINVCVCGCVCEYLLASYIYEKEQKEQQNIKSVNIYALHPTIYVPKCLGKFETGVPTKTRLLVTPAKAVAPWRERIK